MIDGAVWNATVEPEWCEREHEDGEPCASEWRGLESDDGSLMHRVVQRAGEQPMVQVALRATGGAQAPAEVVVEFKPTAHGAGGLRMFLRDLEGDLFVPYNS